MRTITSLSLSLALAIAVLLAARPAATLTSGGPKKRVGVVSFVDKTGHPGVAQAAIDILTTELAKSGKFIVVERAEIEQVLKEQTLGQGGVVNPNTAAQAGKILGLQGIIIGTVSNFGHQKVNTQLTPLLPLAKTGSYASVATVDVRVIDSETAQILFADSGTGAVEIKATNILGMGTTSAYDETIDGGAFRAAVTQFMQNLVNQLDQGEWQGRVIKVSSGTAIVNAGEATGLNLGDELAAFSLGEELIDPDTGISLGKEEGEIRGVCQIISFFGNKNDVSKCKIKSGMIESLDAVKLKKN